VNWVYWNCVSDNKWSWKATYCGSTGRITSALNAAEILSIEGGDESEHDFSPFPPRGKKNLLFFVDFCLAEFNMLELNEGRQSLTVWGRISFAIAANPLLIAALSASLTGDVLRRDSGTIPGDGEGIGCGWDIAGGDGGLVIWSSEYDGSISNITG
jgi:hypothetical protein